MANGRYNYTRPMPSAPHPDMSQCPIPGGDISRFPPRNFHPVDLCVNCDMAWTERCRPCGSNVCKDCLRNHDAGHILLTKVGTLKTQRDKSALLRAENDYSTASASTHKTACGVSKLYDGIIKKATQAKESLLAQALQVQKDNHQSYTSWTDRQDSTHTTHILECQELESQLVNLELAAITFTKDSLDAMVTECQLLETKQKTRNPGSPNLTSCTLNIDNNPTSAVATCAKINLTPFRADHVHTDQTSAVAPVRPKYVAPVRPKYVALVRPKYVHATCAKMELTPCVIPRYNEARVTREVGTQGTGLGEFDFTNLGEFEFDAPWDICRVSSGNFAASDKKNHKCYILDQQLKPLFSFGTKVSKVGTYLDYSTEVSTFDTKGCSVGQFDLPTGVATDSRGLVYVTSANNTVQVFDRDGTHLSSFGHRGSGHGQFNAPHGIAFDSQDNLYVCDRDNKRVEVFTYTGRYLRTLVKTGKGAGKLRSKPLRVSVSAEDDVVITDWLKDGVGDNVYVYDKLGHHIKTLLSGRNTFSTANGTASDRFGNLLVADVEGHCIVVFNKDLERHCNFGTEGRGPGQLWCPVSIALTEDGDVVVCDQGNNKLVMYKVPRL